MTESSSTTRDTFIVIQITNIPSWTTVFDTHIFIITFCLLSFSSYKLLSLLLFLYNEFFHSFSLFHIYMTNVNSTLLCFRHKPLFMTTFAYLFIFTYVACFYFLRWWIQNAVWNKVLTKFLLRKWLNVFVKRFNVTVCLFVKSFALSYSIFSHSVVIEFIPHINFDQKSVFFDCFSSHTTTRHWPISLTSSPHFLNSFSREKWGSYYVVIPLDSPNCSTVHHQTPSNGPNCFSIHEDIIIRHYFVVFCLFWVCFHDQSGSTNMPICLDKSNFSTKALKFEWQIIRKISQNQIKVH